jgi:ribonuclease HI
VVKFTSILEETPGDNLRVIHVDGSSTKKNSNIGMVLKAPSGEQLCNSLSLESRVTNNKAEYEAVIAGLIIAQEMGTECMEIKAIPKSSSAISKASLKLRVKK